MLNQQRISIPQNRSDGTNNLITQVSSAELTNLENQITQESISERLNGYLYINLSQQRQIPDFDNFLNIRLSNPDNLGYFVAYLAELLLRLKLVNNHELSQDERKLCQEFSTIANPDFWLQNSKIYIPLRQSLIEGSIEHDSQNLKLSKISETIDSYIGFIKFLQRHESVIFNRLLSLHSNIIQNFEDKIKEVHINHIILTAKYSLAERDYFKTQTEYSFDKVFIQNCSRADSYEPTLKQFLNYKDFIESEIQNIQQQFLINFQNLLDTLLNNQEPTENLFNLLDGPLVPIAHHKKGTIGNQSGLEPHHGYYPFFRFEDFGFKIPMSLKKLFDNDNNLKNSIPKICYIAELLGLGYFEIDFITKLCTRESRFYTDQAHAVLNQYFVRDGNYTHGFYNYDYQFEMYFIRVASARIKICEFSCYAEQIPVSQEIINVAALLGDMGRYRISIDSAPAPSKRYMDNFAAQTKICAFNQVKHFTITNKLVVSNEARGLEEQLCPIIEQAFTELKQTYQGLSQLLNNQTLLSEDFNKIYTIRNLISAFMHLCGFTDEQINVIKALWREKGSITNLDNFLKNEQKVDFDVKQALNEIIGDGNNQLHQLLQGYKISEITATIDSLKNFLLPRNVIKATPVISLIAAINEGKLDICNSLIPTMDKLTINKADNQGKTALQIAKGKGLKLVEDLIIERLRTIEQDLWKKLLGAINNKNTKEAREILEQIDSNTLSMQDKDGNTALIKAMELKNFEICKSLINKMSPADIIIDKKGATALVWAAYHGNHDLCSLLINKSKNYSSEKYILPFRNAVINGHIKVCELLLSYVGNTKVESVINDVCTLHSHNVDTTFMRAVKKGTEGHLAVCKLILPKMGIKELNLKNNDNKTALDIAKDNNRTEIIELIKIRKQELLIEGVKNHNTVEVEELIQQIDVSELEQVKIGKYSLVMFAAKKGYQNIIEKLIEKMPEVVNAQGFGGKTALMLAAEAGHQDICKYLIDKMSVNAIKAVNKYGSSVLSLAEKQGYTDIAELINAKIYEQQILNTPVLLKDDIINLDDFNDQSYRINDIEENPYNYIINLGGIDEARYFG